MGFLWPAVYKLPMMDKTPALSGIYFRFLALFAKKPVAPGFFLLSYFIVLTLEVQILRQPQITASARSLFFSIAVFLTYGVFYLAPAWLLAHIGMRLSHRAWVPKALAAVGVGIVLNFLAADALLFKLYGFHVNGFVLNIVRTPGGIDSLGAGAGTQAVFALRGIGLMAAPFIVWLGVERWPPIGRALRPLLALRLRYAVIGFMLLTAGERCVYGLSHLQGYTPVLATAGAVSLYQPLSINKLSKKLGVKVERQAPSLSSPTGGRIQYPLQSLKLQAPEKPQNLVVLVAESWRWDMLDPEIMPETWAFARKAACFTRHYSGGNGTRMGLFSLFYGIHGTYWFNMLAERRPPLLMQVLRQQGYQWDMYSSAKFSYPEFDQTIFAEVDGANLHDDNRTPSWEDDRRNVAGLLSFIQNRQPERPFMVFMFFESPHAAYFFPQESVIRPDYLEEFNYATMDLTRDIGKIKNRYINSCRHLDSQFARIFHFLEKAALLENTIVLLTGDHGEEFMEKGRWGHNSEFHEEQLRVPFVLRLPGGPAGQYDHATSHIDFAPTVLPLLGVRNPAADYCLGTDLLDQRPRPFLVCSDWSSLAILDDEFKARLPMSNSGVFRNEVTTREDGPAAAGPYFKSRREQLIAVLQELRRFKLP
jgi:membrane-anchored protein YejM (alkaline phosphatase superfamily)